MALRTPDSYLGTFRERDTPILRATVVDDSVPPVAIPGSSLATMTLTLYDEQTLGIVNGREAVDIKASVDGSGLLVFQLTEDDMSMVTSTRRSEKRRALLEWTWNSTRRGSWEAQFVVENVLQVT